LLKTQTIKVRLDRVLPVLRDGDEFGHVVHLHRAVADERDDRPIGMGELCRNGVGNGGAQRGDPTPTPQCGWCLRRYTAKVETTLSARIIRFVAGTIVVADG
jgi:hypothetical protein